MAFCKVLFCTDFVLDMCVCVWWYKTDFLLWVTAKKSEEYSASEVTADRVWVTRLRVSGSASGPDASFMKVNLPSRPTFVFQGLCPDLPRSQEEVVRAPPYERQRSGGGLKCHWWSVPGDQLAGESISQPLLLCPDSIHPHPSAPIVLSGCRFRDEVSLDVGWDRLPCWSICGLITIITWARRDDRWGVLNLGLSLFQLTIWLLPGNYSSDLFSAVSIQGFWPLTPPCEISKIYLMVKDKDIWKSGHTVLLPDPQSEGGSLRFIPVWIKMSNVVYKLL